MTNRVDTIIPAPIEIEREEDEYAITSETSIEYRGDGVRRVAAYLAERLRQPTGYDLPIVETDTTDPDGSVTLALSNDVRDHTEGYRLTTTERGVSIVAPEPGGLFMGVQTLRQLLPPAIERRSTTDRVAWTVPGVWIEDAPRYGYRGVNLDVARTFFTVDQVDAFLEYVSLYKINHLHLHLTDNPGWRIDIDGWPDLTAIGGRTDFHGGEGGYYTADEYREIVDLASRRGITVVPEIDMPAHVGAAVTAYPELDAEDANRSLPWDKSDDAALNLGNDRTEVFVTDVIDAVVNLTPGPYIHFGGDEAEHVSEELYAAFVDRICSVIERHDKIPIGWQEIIAGGAPNSTVAQYWKPTNLSFDGYDCILSPRDHAYLNFRYDESTPPDGPPTWDRRTVSVRESYDWDPAKLADNLCANTVLGVEAALWAEHFTGPEGLAFMALPRLPGVAERGWSTPSQTEWDGYKRRLAAQAPRWEAMGTDYYRSPQVPWIG